MTQQSDNAQNGSVTGDFTETEIIVQLTKIKESTDFQASAPRQKFLQFVIEETLAGNAKNLKGTCIAMSALGRDANFDPQTDPIVRVEARRLRRDLDTYYATSGRDDPIRISIPKGSYAPRFERQQITGAPPPPIEQIAPAKKPWQHWRLFTFSLSAICLALLSWIIFAPNTQLENNTATPFSQSLPNGPKIAVLPFTLVGEGSDRAYLADGITQQLTTELVRFNDIWVIPLSATPPNNSETSAHVHAQELGAGFALEGSVQEFENSLRITARLIDLQTMRYDWVHTVDADTTPQSIYSAQDEIVQKVIGNLAGKYGILEQDAMSYAARKAPEHLDAYDCVLRYYSYQIDIELTQHSDILKCLQDAVAIEPDYAEAWAVLSNLYLQEVRFDLDVDNSKSIEMARDAVTKAVDLAPLSAFAHSMKSNFQYTQGDIEGFKVSGERAIELNPNNTTILGHYGLRLAFSGDWPRGIEITDKAISLNPNHPKWFEFPRVFDAYRRKDYEAAIELLAPIDMPNFFWVELLETASYGQIGDTFQFQKSAQTLLTKKPDIEEVAAEVISVWRLNPLLTKHILEGLQKAGLDVSP